MHTTQILLQSILARPRGLSDALALGLFSTGVYEDDAVQAVLFALTQELEAGNVDVESIRIELEKERIDLKRIAEGLGEVPPGYYARAVARTKARTASLFAPSAEVVSAINLLVRSRRGVDVALHAAGGETIGSATPPATARGISADDLLRKAKELIAEVRGQPRIMGSLRSGRIFKTNPLERFIRDELNKQFEQFQPTDVPRIWWRGMVHRFAKKMAGTLTADRVNASILAQVAIVLLRELQLLQPVFGSSELPRFLDVLDRISADQVLEIRRLVGGTGFNFLISSADPLEGARKMKANIDAALQALSEAGVTNPRTWAKHRKVALAPSPEEAVQRALALARGESLRKKPLPDETPAAGTPTPAAKAEEPGPLARFLAAQSSEETPKAPARPGDWELFKRLAPAGIFDALGEVLPKIDGTALWTLMALTQDFNRPDREILKYGIIRLLTVYRSHIDPADFALAVKIADHSDFLEVKSPKQKGEAAVSDKVHYNPDRSENSARSAAELIQKSRGIEMRRGFMAGGRMGRETINRVRQIWIDFYSRQSSPVCSLGDWEKLTSIFSTRIALAAGAVPSVDVLSAMVEMVYEEVSQLVLTKNKSLVWTLARFSAAEIKDILERYPKPVAYLGLLSSDTRVVLERGNRNYPALARHLMEIGAQRATHSVLRLSYVLGAESEAEALRRSDEVVAAWRAGRWKAGEGFSGGNEE